MLNDSDSILYRNLELLQRTHYIRLSAKGLQMNHSSLAGMALSQIVPSTGSKLFTFRTIGLCNHGPRKYFPRRLLSIELFDDVTPITVANFLNYVNTGRFNGTVIHRSVPGFVIQGGWLSYNAATNQLDPITLDAAIQNEFSVSNTRGTVAMAKVGGDPNSATSQWFVNLADNSANLDGQNGGFTAFGRVIGDGMTVVDNIAAQPTFTIAGITNFPLLSDSRRRDDREEQLRKHSSRCRSSELLR